MALIRQWRAQRRAAALAAMIAIACAATVASADPPTYRAESSLTSLEFTVSHFGLSMQHGRFREAWGRIVYDPAAASGSVDFVVDPASVDTGWDLRDAFLRSEEMFDIADYPVLRFRSSRMAFADGRLVAIDGDLTLHGVTRPLTLNVARLDCGRNPADGQEGCGAEASGQLRRSDFGMGFARTLIGDEVELRFFVTAFRVPETGGTDTF